MCFGLFDNYASTASPSSTRGKYKPIIVVDLQSNVFDVIKKYMEDNDFENIEANTQYFDLYGEKDKYEYSFIVTRVEGRSIIEISVFNENKRGTEKRKLKRIYSEIDNLFKDKK